LDVDAVLVDVDGHATEPHVHAHVDQFVPRMVT
jgi:hypothetical protein